MPLVKTIGIVLFRRLPRGRQYLLLHHRGRYWNFPKGRAEASDAGNELATAFRELSEETGVPQAAVRVLAGFRATYRYHFTAAAAGRVEQVSKLAVCYLGELIRDCPVTISHEHLGWAWYDPATAWQRLYYANGRKVLAAAERFLDVRRWPAKVKVRPLRRSTKFQAPNPKQSPMTKISNSKLW